MGGGLSSRARASGCAAPQSRSAGSGTASHLVDVDEVATDCAGGGVPHVRRKGHVLGGYVAGLQIGHAMSSEVVTRALESISTLIVIW
jgi:hypothetical protein